MGDVLWRAASFLLVICAGYFLRRRGVFGATEYTVVQRMVMNLTIPAAIIVSFADFQMDVALLGVAVLGFGMNALALGLGTILSRGKSRDERILCLMNLSTYNIGCFALPFLQSFLGAGGVAMACLFDIGNSLVSTGGNYAYAASVVGEGNRGRFSLVETGKKLLHVVPFVTYLFMTLYTAVGFHVPRVVVTLLTPAANANAFASMLVVGLMVDFHMEQGEASSVFRLVALRAGFSAVLAAAIYFLLPVDLEMRRVLTILAVSPISMLSPSFTEQLGGPASTSAAVNSIYAVLSVAAMSLLVVLFGIS